ncbi:MAG: GNAT family N-acetyltransferase [Planctomycetota bacterium]|nr:GNAT family N-acetyltransferase [Planctomycetota bacterium]MDA1114719.1 GNAT family N-acetyltransferase [Planctomycetota bacterium]
MPIQIQTASKEDLPEVRRLLHRTFVSELGQYADGGAGQHADKFEHKNHAYLAWENGVLVGMVAVHGEAPFSVAARLPRETPMQSIADRPLEVRLLCVNPGHRGTHIAFQLMAAVFAHAIANDFHELWISGVEEQLPLYRKLGFEALGPAIADGKVAFTPMRVRLDKLPSGLKRLASRQSTHHTTQTVSLLPGPARLNQATLRAAASAPAYHRADPFLQRYREVQNNLSKWMDGHGIALFPGGGTLANDVLAQTLLRLPDAAQRPGLILCNGEFGTRLIDHARGANLPHQVLDFGWGQTWDWERIDQHLKQHKPSWVWAVHCESSSGMLHSIEKLAARLHPNTALCLDAISTLGVLPLPLGVAFASTVSGKALQALPGIAVVSGEASWVQRLLPIPWPPSLDFSTHVNSLHPPHTLGFPTLAALHASLTTACAPAHIAQRTQTFLHLGQVIRKQLKALGASILAPENAASPAMTTFEIPPGMTTPEFLKLAESWGYVLAGHSSYLKDRRLAQITTYGEFEAQEIAPLFTSWKAWKARI